MPKRLSTTLPSNQWDLQAQELERRRALAQALQAQASTPIAVQPGGRFTTPISSLDVLGKVAQAAGGAYADSRAQRAQRTLSDQRRQALSDTLSGMRGSGVDRLAGGGIAGDSAPAGPNIDALLQNPDTQELGMQMLLQAQAAQQKATEAQSAHQRAVELKAAPGWEKTPDWKDPQYVQVQKEIAGAKAAAGDSALDKKLNAQSTMLDRRLEAQEAMQRSKEEAEKRLADQKAAEKRAAARAKLRPKVQAISALRTQLDKVKKANKDLEGTWSAGPLGQGRMPTEKGEAFDKAVALLAPFARQLTRTPGEGSMSDYESRLAQLALPDRTSREANIARQIQDWEDLISVLESGYTDLEAQEAEPTPPPDAPPPANSPGGRTPKPLRNIFKK